MIINNLNDDLELYIITLLPVEEQSTAMSMLVGLSVRLHISRTIRPYFNFLCILFVVWSSSSQAALQYMLYLVFCDCFRIIEQGNWKVDI